MQPKRRYFLPRLADDLEHGVGIGGLFEGLAEFGFVQQLGDVGQGVEVLLELALRHQEEHDQVDRLVVQGVEVHALLRAAQRADHLVDQVGRGVRDADAKADAGAHGGLALLDHRGDGLAMFGSILPVATRLLISSSMASQRLVARRSVMICSLVRMSPRSIASEPVRTAISPKFTNHIKTELEECEGERNGADEC